MTPTARRMAAGYIAERRDRTRYDEYLARGLQDRRRTAPEVHRHALDRGRRQLRAVGALRTAEPLVRRLLDRTACAGRVAVSAALTKDLSCTQPC